MPSTLQAPVPLEYKRKMSLLESRVNRDVVGRAICQGGGETVGMGRKEAVTSASPETWMGEVGHRLD